MAGNIYLPVVSKFDDKGIQQAESGLGGLGNAVKKFGGLLAGAFAVGVVVDFAKDALTAAENVQVANNRLDSIAQSMGLFGDSAKIVSQRLQDFAQSQELVLGTDAELIKSGQAKLLTFANIAASADEVGGAFDRATMASIDLAAAGFGSIESNAVALGKALQDPIKGITALGRMGVTFTEQEKELIKTLVQSGKSWEAQNIILQAVEKQVGGTAEATATASSKMALAFENIYEEVGMALLPVMEDLVPIVSELAKELGRNLAEAVKEIDWKALVKGVSDFASFVIKNSDAIFEWGKNIAIGATAFVALKTAIDLAKVASVLFAGSPIGALVVALGLLGGAAYLAADAQQQQANSMTEAEKAAEANAQRIAYLKQEQEKYNNLVNRGGIETSYYAGKLAEVTTELTALEEQQKLAVVPTVELTTAYSTMNLTLDNAITKMDFMKNATGDAEREMKLFNDQLTINRGGLTGISDSLDNAKIKIDFFKDGTAKANAEMDRFIDYARRMKEAADRINSIRIPSVGQITYPGQSPIPMAEGGIVLPRRGGTLARIGEAGQAEAVIPLDRLSSMGGGSNYSITINAGFGADPVSIGRSVVDAIRRYENVSGRVFARA